MDDDGGLGVRNWAYYEQPMKGLGLQLMSSVSAERDTKPLLTNGVGGGGGAAAFLHHHHQHHHQDRTIVPMEFVRDSWIQHARDNKNFHHHHHVMPINHSSYHQLHLQHQHQHQHQHHHHHQHHILATEPASAGSQTLHMMHSSELPKEEKSPMIDTEQLQVPGIRNDVTPLKKRGQGRPSNKSLKPRKPKKETQPQEGGNGTRSVSGRGKGGEKKSTGLVINGIDLDISGIPTPVCSCTGAPQQCYRWGVGGWQSACCTTSISMYPLPMSTKRRGARIAGRKMSQGAFVKVLEKLAGEGHNLSHPIDLKGYWAKHGTNKFVTIR